MAHEPLPAGSERDADGDLLLARRRAREQQVRDVRARDEQDERHGAHHDQHRASHVADDGFDERHDVDREGSVALVLVPNPRGDGGDVGVRLRHRHARFQPRHEIVVLIAAAIHGIGAQRERQKQIHLLRARHRRHDLGVQQEVGVEDADNLELRRRIPPIREAVEHDPFADDVGIGVERALPKRVAEHDDGRFAWDVFVGQQQSTVAGLGAEEVEEARRRQERLDPLRFGEGRLSGTADQRSGATLRDRELGERSILVLDVDELSR